MDQVRGYRLERHLVGNQPVLVLGEHGRGPYGMVDAQPNEPPEQGVAVHVLPQLLLRADGEQDLDQARPDQPFRRDRGAPEVGVGRV